MRFASLRSGQSGVILRTANGGFSWGLTSYPGNTGKAPVFNYVTLAGKNQVRRRTMTHTARRPHRMRRRHRNMPSREKDVHVHVKTTQRARSQNAHTHTHI